MGTTYAAPGIEGGIQNDDQPMGIMSIENTRIDLQSDARI